MIARESPTLAMWISFPWKSTEIEVVPLIESSNDASCIYRCKCIHQSESAHSVFLACFGASNIRKLPFDLSPNERV